MIYNISILSSGVVMQSSLNNCAALREKKQRIGHEHFDQTYGFKCYLCGCHYFCLEYFSVQVQ